MIAAVCVQSFIGDVMKKFLGSLLTLATLVSCNGGSGSGTTSGPTTGPTTPSIPTHNELAASFVQQLNLDAEFDVELVKSTTEQLDFIVIYDPLTESYDAIDIFSYDPNLDNAVDFYFDYIADNYFDLEFLPAFTENGVYFEDAYRDYDTGLIFEKTVASSKDLAKITAIKEALEIQKTAEFFSSEFGLSLNRGKEIAGLKAHWKKASKKGMTTSEVDNFSSELLGFSLTSGISAYSKAMNGDTSSLDSLVKQSAVVNGISPEHATRLMTKVFGL